MPLENSTSRKTVEVIDREIAAEFDTDPELRPIVLDHDPDIDTIIVSDIHLGSEVSRAKRLLALLRSYRFTRIILNGDVFDDINFKRLSKDDWKLLSYIRKISNPRRNIDVVWVIGNHDGVAEILSHLLGVHVHDEYVFEIHGIKHLAIHGHQFDKWITEHVTITSIASTIYLWLQKIDQKHRVSRWVKQRSKKWLRLSDKVAHDAVMYGIKQHGAKAVFCGHTHRPIQQDIAGVHYVNSGSWTDKPSQYITIDHQGMIVLRELH